MNDGLEVKTIFQWYDWTYDNLNCANLQLQYQIFFFNFKTGKKWEEKNVWKERKSSNELNWIFDKTKWDAETNISLKEESWKERSMFDKMWNIQKWIRKEEKKIQQR